MHPTGLSRVPGRGRRGGGSSCAWSAWTRNPRRGSSTRSSGCADPAPLTGSLAATAAGRRAAPLCSRARHAARGAQEKRQRLDKEAEARTAKKRTKRLKQKARLALHCSRNLCGCFAAWCALTRRGCRRRSGPRRAGPAAGPASRPAAARPPAAARTARRTARALLRSTSSACATRASLLCHCSGLAAQAGWLLLP